MLLRQALAAAMTLLIMFGVKTVQAQVLTSTADGVRVNWTEGVLEGVGVGRSSYDSAIARPSRETHFKAALQDAERRLTSAIGTLWKQAPLHRANHTNAPSMAKQALTAFPPKVSLLSDGTVHAEFNVPLSILEPTQRSTLYSETQPIVLRIAAPYTPTLGLLWCYANETRSTPQIKITHHRSVRELPAYVRSAEARQVKGRFDTSFQCVRLSESQEVAATWNRMSELARVYVVHQVENVDW